MNYHIYACLYSLIIIYAYHLTLNSIHNIIMNSDYLKKPVLSKKIEYKTLETFSYVSCEMQGKAVLM